MDQLKQVPGFRRWKKDRKHFIRILLVMSLSFFLMEFSFLLSDSLETTLDQRRKDAYGEWQFALLNLGPSLGETHTLDQNPFIEHFGYIWSQGMLANDGLDGDYGVGGIRLMILFYLFLEYPALCFAVTTAYMLAWALDGRGYPIFGVQFGMRLFAVPAVMLASLPIRRKTQLPKWLTYGFYPAHLIILLILEKIF